MHTLIKITRIILLTVLVLLVSFNANSQQWILKNPLPTDADLLNVYMINPDTGFVCGSRQTILKTTDGGVTWKECCFHADNYLYGITFSSRDTGFAVGWEGSILKTIDCGETWALMPQPFNSDPTDLFDVFFLDKNNGWISGSYYSVLRTQNGGATWSVLSHNVGIDQKFNFIRFVSPDTGFVAGGMISGMVGHLKKTTNGGITWTDITIPAEIEKVSGLSVLSSKELWIGAFNQVGTTNGPATRVYHTIDGGVNWNPSDLVYNGPTVTSIKFFNPLRGFVLCVYRTYSTTDGGNTWQEKYLGDYSLVFNSMYWPDTSKCILAGDYGYIYGSDDGGQTWQEKSHGTKTSFNDIFFTNDKTGYAVGYLENSVAISHTTDGGETWLKTPLDSTRYGSLTSVDFSDKNNGWAVGYWDWILHTIDAGQTWNSVEVETGNTYYAVKLYTSKYIWIGGHPSKMLHSSDYGATWQDFIFPVSGYDVRKICFVDSLNGYATLQQPPPYVQTESKMFKTNDGGNSWVPINYINSSVKEVQALSFPSINEGFIVIYNVGIAKTNDGGNTWQVLGKINGLVPTFVQFKDTLNGIAGDYDYFVASTSDGGQTWSTLLDTLHIDDNAKNYFFFPDLSHGWLAGWYGLIKQYTSTNTGIFQQENQTSAGPLIYPNPVADKLGISFPAKIRKVEVFTLTGILLMTYYSSDLKSVDISAIKPGLYILELSTAKKDYFVKFVKD